MIAAKAICFKEAMTAEFVAYSKQVLVNAATLARELAGHGFRVVSGGTDTHLMLVDVFAKGRARQGGRAGARSRLHYGQQERDSV
jgi:glycine hydroxymethyltransferase